MTELPPAVEVQNLRKVYGNKAAVDGLSLTVAQGSFFWAATEKSVQCARSAPNGIGVRHAFPWS